MKGIFPLGNNISVVWVGSDSGDDVVSISDDENNYASDQNVSSTVPDLVAQVDGKAPILTELKNIPMDLTTRVPEPLKTEDIPLGAEGKPTPLSDLESMS